MGIILLPGHYFGTERQSSDNASCKINITTYQQDEVIHEHYHENAYVSLLINGRYNEVHKKGDNIIQPGEILFRPSGYSHANHFHGTGRCLNIEFKQEWMEQLDFRPGLPQSVAIFKNGSFEEMYRLLYSFLADAHSHMPEEYIISWLGNYATTPVPQRLQWLPKVKAILENEFEGHHTIQSLAQRVFTHPIYLARAFKERVGMTVGEYQLRMRLRKATMLLFTSSMAINDIAFACGFTDAPHLIRSFRVFYHVTPRKYRQLLNS
ncbi:Helix-turn-helix domain-containing protein [Chitinophaga jiangningensis]|uniref:Helix-turn-helix domain-containing protein n=1 Tax=Chitinophaga jiangningensis TaxID=1419482 RepID=A0A1M7CLE8_9BACT|nr:helix-turn-helix domain-containing protein [Chitinophaga jiangningensis]SHL67992.1 Helix-turn-helix domain-containing protein [Chitinophaga jiangningensis]